MACPRFLPWLDHNSKISVLPAPVGACTTTSWPSRNAATACCCHRSGTLTWLSTGSSANCEAKEDTKTEGLNYNHFGGLLRKPRLDPEEPQVAEKILH